LKGFRTEENGNALKIKNLRFCGQIDQMGAAIEHHVREKFRLVNLTGFGTWDSNPDGYLVLNQVRQIIIRTVTGRGFYPQVPLGIGPLDTIVNEKNIRGVPF
jgi:hypothetical protein